MMISTYLIEALATVEQALGNQSERLLQWQSACQKLSHILQAMGLFEASRWWQSVAFQSQLGESQIYGQIGELYSFVQQWQAAIAAYEKALSLSDNPVIYASLASIYHQLGQMERALSAWYNAFRLSPEPVTAENGYKLGQALLKQGKLAEAIDCHQKVIAADANFWPSYYALGEIFLAQQAWEQARECYEKLFENEPNQARASHKLGTLWLKQNQIEPAIAQFRQTIQLKPDFPWAYRELLKLFIEREQWDEALATGQALMATGKEYPWVYLYLGNCYSKKGNLAEASLYFQKACQGRGWLLCPRKNYYFTQDNFTPKIPIWTSHLEPLANQAEIQALEIGCFQGMSACWLLDHILTHGAAKLTCIEKSLTEPFLSNLEKTGAAEKVTILEGKPLKLLASLEANRYDLINLQDGRKKATAIEQNANLCWKLLKVGGLMIFSDYAKANAPASKQESKMGIDTFLNSVKGKSAILHQSNQVILEKIAP